MANTYTYLKNVFHELKQEHKNHSSALFVLLVLLSIPLSYAVNSISLGLLVIGTLIMFKKENLKIDIYLFLPILLYFLMFISLIWSIDSNSTLKALSKELPLLIIPLCFLLFRSFSSDQKQKIIKYYSYGILLFTVFYFIKATIRFLLTQDTSVFFYHELVTKDVNAIHVSVYVALAFFYFFTKSIKSFFDIAAILLLLVLVFLLSSKNITIVFVGLMIFYFLFYSKTSQRFRMKNLILFILILIPVFFIGKIKERFIIEYQTITTENTANIENTQMAGKVFNKSIKEAWTNTTFTPSDYFPGTAFRVYQFRIFTEMLKEDPIFYKGYGLNASNSKIQEKAKQYNLDPGYGKFNFHNQYIQNFAELGIFGLLLLLAILFVNLKNALKTKDFIHISFAVLMISLFLTESFLWRQRGVMFFTAMYCLFNSEFIPITSKKE